MKQRETKKKMRAVIAAVQNQEEADSIIAEYLKRKDLEIVFFDCLDNKLTIVYEFIDKILETFDVCKRYSDKVIASIKLTHNKILPLLKKKGCFCAFSKSKRKYEVFKNEVKIGSGKTLKEVVKTLWWQKDVL